LEGLARTRTGRACPGRCGGHGGCTRSRTTRRSPSRKGRGRLGAGVEQLALHRGPERLDHRVVDAGGDPAHGSQQAGVTQRVAEDPGRVLRSTVGADHGAGLGRRRQVTTWRASTTRSVLMRSAMDQPTTWRVKTRAPHSSRPSRAGWGAREVGAPQPVRCLGDEPGVARGRRGSQQPVCRGAWSGDRFRAATRPASVMPPACGRPGRPGLDAVRDEPGGSRRRLVTPDGWRGSSPPGRRPEIPVRRGPSPLIEARA
jgi:hypothetical protein